MAHDQMYKNKYLELKTRFMSSVDTAWKLGYEQGLKDSQLQQAQDQAAQAQQAQMGGQPGQPGAPGKPGEATTDTNGNEIGDTADTKVSEPEMPDPNEQSQNPQGSELDQHIAELEGLMGKSEFSTEDLHKALEHIKLIKNEVQTVHVPHLVKVPENLDPSSKEALKIQNDIVSRVMSKWNEEESRASKDIMENINMDGLLQKR